MPRAKSTVVDIARGTPIKAISCAFMGTKTTLALAAAISSAAYVCGAPGWAVGSCALLIGFFGFGGWRISRLAYKTLPRDIL